MSNITKIVFKCNFCEKRFKSEEKRNTHSLFYHLMLMPTCNNNKLIDSKIEEYQRIRREWKEEIKKYKKYARVLTPKRIRQMERYCHSIDMDKLPISNIFLKKTVQCLQRLDKLEREAYQQGILLT